MKAMSAMQPGNFYGNLPDSYSLVVNSAQKTVRKITDEATAALREKVEPIRAEIEKLNNEITAARKEAADKKEKMPECAEQEGKVNSLRADEEKIISEYAAGQPLLRQIIDLALLQSNLLKGEEMSAFIARSVSML